MNFNDKVRAMALRLIWNNNAIINAASEATEPKVYIALLTQSGTDAPVATVLKNTLGGVPVWSYSSVGVYNAELSNAFTGDLIGFAYSGWDDEATFTNFMVVKTDNSNLFISTEGIPVNYHINIRLKIEVYP